MLEIIVIIVAAKFILASIMSAIFSVKSVNIMYAAQGKSKAEFEKASVKSDGFMKMATVLLYVAILAACCAFFFTDYV